MGRNGAAFTVAPVPVISGAADVVAAPVYCHYGLRMQYRPAYDGTNDYRSKLQPNQIYF